MLAAAVALGVTGCTRNQDLAQTNIEPSTGGAPILDHATLLGGKLVLDDAKLGGIRAAMEEFHLSASVEVNGSHTGQDCPDGPETACLWVDYWGSSFLLPQVKVNGPTLSPAIVNYLGYDVGDWYKFDGFDYYRAPPFGDFAAAYEVEVLHDPAGIQVARRAGRALAYPDVDEIALWFPVTYEFPAEQFVKDYACDCTKSAPFAVPGHYVFPDDIAGGCTAACTKDPHCDKVYVKTRLNRARLWLGFVPQLPATGSGAWTTKFGGKEFNVPKMFDLRVAWAGVPDGNAYWPGMFDGDASKAEAAAAGDAVHDVAVSVDLIGCPWGVEEEPEKNASREVADFAGSWLYFLARRHAEMKLGPLFSFDEPGDAFEPCKLPMSQEPNLPPCEQHMLMRASFTYQLWDWLYGAFGPYANGAYLPIKAIEPVADPLQGDEPEDWSESRPATVSFLFDGDPDGDGIPSPEDDCWQIWNKDKSKSDKDQDGVVDGCDPFPCDPYNDVDGDGVPGPSAYTYLCPGEPVDNCPVHYNPLQENCNRISEKVHTPKLIWGDACDPVPCPDERGEPYTKDAGGKSGKIKCWHKYRDKLEVRALSSHKMTPKKLDEPKLVDRVSLMSVPTPVRWCQEKPSLGITCRDKKVDIRDARLTDVDCAPSSKAPKSCTSFETDKSHFHRMSFYKKDQANGPDPNDPALPVDYFHLAEEGKPGLDWQWRYKEDRDRWCNGKSPLIPKADGECPELLGTLWLHADTKVGWSKDVTTGLHGPQLANHHEHGYLPYEHVCKWVDPVEDIDPPSYLIHWPGQEPPPLPPPVELLQASDAVPGEASYVVQVGDGEWGVINHDGNAELVTDKLGPELLALAAQPGPVWANAVEPFAYQGAGPTFPGAVALSADGSELLMSVTSDGTGLQGDGDRPLCPEVVGLEPPPTFIGSFFGYGPELGQWEHPFAVAVDDAPEGRVFVSDTHAVRICRLEADGTGPLCWGSQCNLYDGYVGFPPGYGCVDPDGDGPLGLGDGQCAKYAHGPDEWALAFDPVAQRLFMDDNHNCRVQAFAPDGTFLFKFGSRGTDPGQFVCEMDL
ncbi:MAG: hypothetical protein HY744_27205, partial [Deltaproteobacteria bacterium]|nr:hypothetical protein [Deltaproteobacteria bacterium]